MRPEMIPCLRLPLPGGGEICCLTAAILGATTHTSNQNWVDVYIDGIAPDGITCEIDMDVFSVSWMTALLVPMDDIPDSLAKSKNEMH